MAHNMGSEDLVFKDLVDEYRGAQQPLVVVEIGTALGGTVETSGWIRSTWVRPINMSRTRGF